MTMTYDHILIDANSVFYAAHNAQVLNNKSVGHQVQAIFFGLKMIKRAIDTFAKKGHTQVLVLWDSKAQWRFDLLPEYKGKREDTPEKVESRKQYKLQAPLARKALALLGLEQRFAEGEEADDLGAALSQSADLEGEILLVTGDGDWLQLVRPGVSWYDPREEGRWCSQLNFTEFTGYANANQFIQAKAMNGDSSDNISGVAGVGDKAIAHIFNYWGNVSKLFDWAKAHESKGEFVKGDLPDELSRHRKAMSLFCFGEGKRVFQRNLKLMNLRSPRHRDGEILSKQVILKTKFDEAGFTDFCHELAFMNMTKNMKSWINTFE